jgi:hypothetical protein
MLVARQSLPRFVEIGVAQTLTLDVYPEDSATLSTASTGTLTLKQGSTVLLDAVSVTVGGTSTASYSLLAATTSGKDPSDDLLEIWTLTIDGAIQTFQRGGYLVRRAWHPTITDADLIDYHSDLVSLRPSSLTTYEPYRRRAGNWVQTELLARGRRPWLLFDAWALTVPHIYKALALIFADFESSVGDGRYGKLAAAYEGQATEAMRSVMFRYDVAETGTIDDLSQVSAAMPIFLSSGPNSARDYWRRVW